MEKTEPLANAQAAPARIHPLALAAIILVASASAWGIYTTVTTPQSHPAAPGWGPPAAAPATAVQAAAVTPAPPAAAPTPNSATAAPAPGSAPAPETFPSAAASAANPACPDCAVVTAIRLVTEEGQSSGLGAVGGGVAGGLLGSTIGRGDGRTAMTLLGAVGGAVAGNAIEKQARTRTQYELSVRFDDGHEQVFSARHPWKFKQGDLVRVVHGHVKHR